jgi:hypothetical protein
MLPNRLLVAVFFSKLLALFAPVAGICRDGFSVG